MTDRFARPRWWHSGETTRLCYWDRCQLCEANHCPRPLHLHVVLQIVPYEDFVVALVDVVDVSALEERLAWAHSASVPLEPEAFILACRIDRFNVRPCVCRSEATPTCLKVVYPLAGRVTGQSPSFSWPSLKTTGVCGLYRMVARSLNRFRVALAVTAGDRFDGDRTW